MHTTTITDCIIAADYCLSFEQMIAIGDYDCKNDKITETNFPVQRRNIVEFEARLFHFDRRISSDNAIECIISNTPWEPATIEHLLAFGAKYPEEQCKYPIVGLGSVAEVDGSRSAPCLSRGGASRGLGLARWDGGWAPSYRFLAVRRLSSS